MRKRVLIIQPMMMRYRVPFFRKLYQALREKGIELRVIYGDPPVPEEEREGNIDLREPYVLKVRNRWLFGKRLLFQSVFREANRADLIIVEQATKHLMNNILLFFSALGMKKVAYWGHGYNSKGEKNSISERLKRRLINRVDWWFAYTGGTTQYLLECGVPGDIITTVCNSVDTKVFKEALDAVSPSELIDARRTLGLDENRRIGLFCGRIYPEKHVGFLLKASVRIKEALPEFELLVIGGGPEKDVMVQAARDYSWVHYIGPKYGHEKAIFFRMAHVFLNPGLVGLAILDCFTAGLPMITTDVPVHSPEIEYLEDGVNGLMIPHIPERFATEVVRLIGDTERLARMREEAEESGRKYTIETMVQNFQNGITCCLSL